MADNADPPAGSGGGTAPAGDDTAKAELAAARLALKAAEDKAAAAERAAAAAQRKLTDKEREGLSDVEKERKRADDAEARAQALEAQMETDRRVRLLEQAAASKIDPAALGDLARLVDPKQLEAVNDKTTAEATVAALLEQKPYLVPGPREPADMGGPHNPGDGAPATNDPKDGLKALPGLLAGMVGKTQGS